MTSHLIPNLWLAHWLSPEPSGALWPPPAFGALVSTATGVEEEGGDPEPGDGAAQLPGQRREQLQVATVPDQQCTTTTTRLNCEGLWLFKCTIHGIFILFLYYYFFLNKMSQDVCFSLVCNVNVQNNRIVKWNKIVHVMFSFFVML